MQSDALLDVLTPDVLPDGKLYYNIAERTVRPTIEQSHELFGEAAAQIQKQLNENAGIGLRAVTPKLDEDRVRGIIDKISDAPLFEDVRWVLNEPIRVLVQSFADEFVKANAEFQADAGLSPTITRTVVGGCCQWCRALAGKYTYPREVPKDVYRRRAYCRCLVTYDPADGSKRVQNVHSKKWATREELEERKTVEIAEMQRRKIGKDGQEIIDQPTYRKLTRSFVRSGGIIIRGKEADLHLAQMGAHASYIPGMGVAFIRDDATVSDVLEEMYHAKQDRQNAYLNLPSDEAVLRREIDAQEYLLDMAEKYQIPTNETNITRRNLADYQRMLRELKGEG